MTDSTPEAPNWDLLPHDPEGFFGLEEGFDRKDLRRSYNKLIRRFKPEKHPGEFQAIRAAFEQVDDDLRYHTDRRPAPSAPDIQWQTSDTAESSPTAAETHGTPAGREAAAGNQSEAESPAETEAVDVLAEARATSPEAAFAKLRAIEPKQPQTYYHLAILSDVVDLPDRGDFIDWICRGLDAFPHDGHLLRLLYAHCHSPAGLVKPESMLRRVAGSVSTRAFGYVTEPVWLELIKKFPFAKVCALLDACWAKISDRDVAGRGPLTLRLTNRALFIADEDWLLEQMAFLWENQSESFSEEEFHEVDLLMSYRAWRPEFLNGDPVRRDIDQLIRNFSELEETEADRAFLAWRVKYLSRGEEILEALPYTEEQNLAAMILTWYANEVDDRLSDTELELSSKRRRTIASNFINRVDRLTDRSPIGWLSHACNIVSIFGIPVGLLVAAIGIGKLAENAGIHFWPTLIVCILAFAALFLKVILPLFFRLDDVLMDKCHRKVWRGEALRVLNQEPLAMHAVGQTIQNDKVMSDMSIANDLLTRIYQDPGLAVCSLLRQRVRES